MASLNRASSSSPTPARISRRARIANKQHSTADPLLNRYQKPAAEQQANHKKSPLKFQRSATSEGIVRCNSPWQKRKTAMQRRRKSSPTIKVPNFNWTLESDSDSDSEEEEEKPQQQLKSSGNAWDQRKSALRERSKSPMNDPQQRQPRRNRNSNKKSPSRWESSSSHSSSRSNSPTRERRASNTEERSSRWESSCNTDSRSNSPTRERRASACINTEQDDMARRRSSSPRLPKRQISDNPEGKPGVPSPFGASSSDTMDNLKVKVQMLKAKSEQPVAQTA